MPCGHLNINTKFFEQVEIEARTSEKYITLDQIITFTLLNQYHNIYKSLC